MLDLNDFIFFVHIVDRGGFTAAGRVLKIPKTTLSNRMKNLEARLGIRLLNRTTRRFAVTEAGAEFYRHAAGILERAEDAEAAIRYRLTQPNGTVKFTAGVAVMQFAMRHMVSRFIAQYPEVNVVGHATDAAVDIVGESYDLAVRAHSTPLPDSTLIKRNLAQVEWWLFAGARYLDQQPAPLTPDDLRGRPSLFMMRAATNPAWRLRRAGEQSPTVFIPLVPRMMTDDMIGLKQAAIDGLGIVALPSYICRDELREGSMKRVLPEWIAGDATLTALLPYRQGLLPSVRAFVDHIAAEFPKVV